MSWQKLVDDYVIPASHWTYDNLPPLLAFLLHGIAGLVLVPVGIAYGLLVPPRFRK